MRTNEENDCEYNRFLYLNSMLNNKHPMKMAMFEEYRRLASKFNKKQPDYLRTKPDRCHHGSRVGECFICGEVF